MNNKKISRPLIIVLGLILLAGIIFIVMSVNKKHTDSQTTLVEEIVVTPASFIKISQSPDIDTSSWNTFSDEKLKFSIKYPSHIILDERQTVQDKLYVFIFDEDKVKRLPGKVTALYIADTHKKGVDGFTAFRQSDCGRECNISYKTVPWVNINNVYGIQNPLPADVHNYYLTDKTQTGSVINVYIGGYLDKKDIEVQDKIETFEQVIKTIQFDR